MTTNPSPDPITELREAVAKYGPNVAPGDCYVHADVAGVRSLLAAYDALESDHHRRGVAIIGMDEHAGAHLVRAEKAEAKVAELTADPTAARQAAVGEGERDEELRRIVARAEKHPVPTRIAKSYRSGFDCGYALACQHCAEDARQALAPASPVAVEERQPGNGWQLSEEAKAEIEAQRQGQIAGAISMAKNPPILRSDAPPTGGEGGLLATPEAEQEQLLYLIRKYGRYDEDEGPWSDEIKAAVRKVEDRFGIFLVASDYMASQFERAERAEKRLAKLASPSPIASGAEAEDVAGLVEEWTPDLESARIALCELLIDLADAEGVMATPKAARAMTDAEAALTLLSDHRNRLAAALFHQARASVEEGGK